MVKAPKDKVGASPLKSLNSFQLLPTNCTYRVPYFL
jgi:hypothetical protein